MSLTQCALKRTNCCFSEFHYLRTSLPAPIIAFDWYSLTCYYIYSSNTLQLLYVIIELFHFDCKALRNICLAIQTKKKKKKTALHSAWSSFDVRLGNVGYMLICRLNTYHMAGAPLAEGNFLPGKSATFRIIVQNDFSNRCTLTQTHVQMHGLLANPFNAATQWGSVSNAALDFLAWKQGALCWSFRAFFECSRAIFPLVRIFNIL